MQQQLDRSVPLGEMLVRMGVVSRDDLQTALARKMGYPLVDLDAFPVEAEALRKLSYARRRAPARDAAADARRPPGRRARRPVAPRRRRRGRVQRRDEGGAGARRSCRRSTTPCTRPTRRSARRQIAHGRPGDADRLRARLRRRCSRATTDELVETLEKEGLERPAERRRQADRAVATTRWCACSTT